MDLILAPTGNNECLNKVDTVLSPPSSEREELLAKYTMCSDFPAGSCHCSLRCSRELRFQLELAPNRVHPLVTRASIHSLMDALYTLKERFLVLWWYNHPHMHRCELCNANKICSLTANGERLQIVHAQFPAQCPGRHLTPTLLFNRSATSHCYQLC